MHEYSKRSLEFSTVKNLGQKKMCKMWKNKPQHTKSLARRKKSEQGQGEIISPKGIKFLRGQKGKSIQGKRKRKGKRKRHQRVPMYSI